MITQQVGGYWLAEQHLHGRTLLAEGNTRSEAMDSMYTLMDEHHTRHLWADGYRACKEALTSGLSVWKREVCPFDDGTPSRDGWITYVSEQVQELRQYMGERA